MEKFANEVWVFIEQRSGKPADVSFELLSKGRKLAEVLKGALKSVVIGSEMKDVAQQTFQYGAKECLLVDHPELKDYKTVPYSRIMNELVSKHKPRVVLYGAKIYEAPQWGMLFFHNLTHIFVWSSPDQQPTR